MSQVSMDSTSAPRSAGKNPATTNPGTTSVIAQKRSAFRTNENNPSVMMVMGSVRIESTSLMTITITDHTSATRRIVTHPPPTVIPGTMLTVRYTAATVPRYFNTVCILGSCQVPAASFQIIARGKGLCLEAGSSQLEAILIPLLFVVFQRDERGVVVFGLRVEHFAEHLFAYRSEFFLLIVVMKHHISRF